MGYTKNKKPAKFDAKAALEKKEKAAKEFAGTHEAAIKAGEEGRKALAEEASAEIEAPSEEK